MTVQIAADWGDLNHRVIKWPHRMGTLAGRALPRAAADVHSAHAADIGAGPKRRWLDA
jgi:hypothetical protein